MHLGKHHSPSFIFMKHSPGLTELLLELKLVFCASLWCQSLWSLWNHSPVSPWPVLVVSRAVVSWAALISLSPNLLRVCAAKGGSWEEHWGTWQVCELCGFSRGSLLCLHLRDASSTGSGPLLIPSAILCQEKELQRWYPARGAAVPPRPWSASFPRSSTEHSFVWDSKH